MNVTKERPENRGRDPDGGKKRKRIRGSDLNLKEQDAGSDCPRKYRQRAERVSQNFIIILQPFLGLAMF